MSILGNLTSPTSLNLMNIQNVMLALIAIGWFHCGSTNHVDDGDARISQF